jgi:hypothetical protein
MDTTEEPSVTLNLVWVMDGLGYDGMPRKAAEERKRRVPLRYPLQICIRRFRFAHIASCAMCAPSALIGT